MGKTRTLDVREISKPFRKRTIFGLFDQMHDNDCLELISDHNLGPLNKLFQIEKDGFFEWSELQGGPQLWKVLIRKIESLNLTINEILKRFPFAIEIFERNSIPYYKFGWKKLSELSDRAEDIYNEILTTTRYLANPLRTELWSIDFTVDYIINNHHTFVRQMMPEIEGLIDHLVQAHASTHPQLPMIRERFTDFRDELSDHMKDEEESVFPSFKKMDKDIGIPGVEVNREFEDTISWMEEDHILTGSSLKSLRNFCTNYVAPESCSPGFKILYEELQKFEADMHFHMHLENNVLFQKVMKVHSSNTELRRDA